MWSLDSDILALTVSSFFWKISICSCKLVWNGNAGSDNSRFRLTYCMRKLIIKTSIVFAFAVLILLLIFGTALNQFYQPLSSLDSAKAFNVRSGDSLAYHRRRTGRRTNTVFL